MENQVIESLSLSVIKSTIFKSPKCEKISLNIGFSLIPREGPPRAIADNSIKKIEHLAAGASLTHYLSLICRRPFWMSWRKSWRKTPRRTRNPWRRSRRNSRRWTISDSTEFTTIWKGYKVQVDFN